MTATHTEQNMADRIFDITNDKMWAGGLADARGEARSKGKFLLIAAGAEAARSWKLGVALAFLDEDMIKLSRKFHCVTVGDSRAADQRLTDRPTIMICTPEGREIVSATADTIEELIPALRGMLEHVLAVELPAKKRPACVADIPARPSLGRFLGMLAHAVLGA